MPEHLATIHANVKFLLERYPELRDPLRRKQAHIKYWQTFQGVGTEIPLETYPKLVSVETLNRAIRKTQELDPELAPDEAGEKVKRRLQTKFYEEYKK